MYIYHIYLYVSYVNARVLHRIFIISNGHQHLRLT